MLARGPGSVKVRRGAGPSAARSSRRHWRVWLGAAPLLQALSLAGLRVAGFAPDRPWNYIAYGLFAPYVAWLVWHRHPRARFVAYVFFTHEAVRGVHFHRWDAVRWRGSGSCSCSCLPRDDGFRPSAPRRCGHAGDDVRASGATADLSARRSTPSRLPCVSAIVASSR